MNKVTIPKSVLAIIPPLSQKERNSHFQNFCLLYNKCIFKYIDTNTISFSIKQYHMFNFYIEEMLHWIIWEVYHHIYDTRIFYLLSWLPFSWQSTFSSSKMIGIIESPVWKENLPPKTIFRAIQHEIMQETRSLSWHRYDVLNRGPSKEVEENLRWPSWIKQQA